MSLAEKERERELEEEDMKGDESKKRGLRVRKERFEWRTNPSKVAVTFYFPFRVLCNSRFRLFLLRARLAAMLC
jgi:hypothetical protein